jgi:hypothetical protein
VRNSGVVSRRLPSRSAASSALGNLTSLAFWPGVPNPIELDSIAFNLADAFVLLGFATTAAATLTFAVRNRERLREPL